MIRVAAAILLLLTSASPVLAQRCFSESAVVSLVGTISIAAGYGPPGFGKDPAHDRKYQYLLLTLDKPVCLDSEFGDVAVGWTVAVVFTAGGLPRDKVGAHVSVSGKLVHRENANEPPQDLVMFDPVIRRIQR
jgi:hypothetical protein